MRNPRETNHDRKRKRYKYESHREINGGFGAGAKEALRLEREIKGYYGDFLRRR